MHSKKHYIANQNLSNCSTLGCANALPLACSVYTATEHAMFKHMCNRLYNGHKLSCCHMLACMQTIKARDSPPYTYTLLYSSAPKKETNIDNLLAIAIEALEMFYLIGSAICQKE